MFNKTEEEQIEIIKQWFRNNFIWLILLLVVISAGTVGWSYIQQNNIDDQLQASALYEDVERRLRAMQQAEQSEREKLLTEIADSHSTLTTLFPDNIYTLLSSQLYATALINAGKLEQATTELKSLTNSEDTLIKSNSKIALAKVYWQLGEIDQAMAILANPGIGFEAIAKEIEGDIYLSQNKIEQAATAYQQAIDNQSTPSSELQIKLNYVTN